MPFPVAIRAGVLQVSCALTIFLLSACRDQVPSTTDRRGEGAGTTGGASQEGRGRAGGATDVSGTAELASLLERAAGTGILPEAERLALERAMELVLQPVVAVCGDCETTVSYVDEAERGDYFRCYLGKPSGERIAEIQVFHRPYLAADAAKNWGRATLHGHPASSLAGRHLFVWPGRFEIRAFARAESLRGGEALERWVESLPLDALARL